MSPAQTAARTTRSKLVTRCHWGTINIRPNSHGSFASLDRDNLKSFVHGILLHREPVEDLPAEHTTSFAETLAVLMGARKQVDPFARTRVAPFDRAIFSQGVSNLIVSMEEDGRQSTLATKLRHMFRGYLPPPAVLPIPSPSPASTPTPTPAPIPAFDGIGGVSQETFYASGSTRDPTLQLPV
jgi:hypothetical protein